MTMHCNWSMTNDSVHCSFSWVTWEILVSIHNNMTSLRPSSCQRIFLPRTNGFWPSISVNVLILLRLCESSTMGYTILRNLFVLTSAAIFLGTLILNLLAIVYISSKRDKTSIAILVVNLAIADIIHASMFDEDESCRPEIIDCLVF